ncbi:MAG TPA: helix-turn-helix domain-containing protein, partial [Ktedonobacterales bacterium]|nr:helix-turn-helix domain-containing protein [Ktedonobacterales bacterium]
RMARRIHLRPGLSVDELERRYRAAKEPHERSWWQILWLLGRGQLAKDIAESTGYSRYWIGQIAKRYNAEGPEGMHNRQYTHSHRAAPLLSPEHLAALAAAVRGPAPEGDDWTGRLVAAWGSNMLLLPAAKAVGRAHWHDVWLPPRHHAHILTGVRLTRALTPACLAIRLASWSTLAQPARRTASQTTSRRSGPTTALTGRAGSRVRA